MNIVGYSSQSYNPALTRDSRDSEGALARRKQQLEEEKDQRRQASQPVGDAEQSRETKEVTRVGSLQAINKQYEAKPAPDFSSLSNSQQKALRAYSETDVFSRIDGNTDYLGSIDLFV